MPIYDYACGACGPFRDWRPMSASQEGASCPSCGGSASRMVSMPALRRTGPHIHAAHERNERSAEQPRVVPEREWRAGDRHAGHAHHHHDHGRGMYRPNMLGHAH